MAVTSRSSDFDKADWSDDVEVASIEEVATQGVGSSPFATLAMVLTMVAIFGAAWRARSEKRRGYRHTTIVSRRAHNGDEEEAENSDTKPLAELEGRAYVDRGADGRGSYELDNSEMPLLLPDAPIELDQPQVVKSLNMSIQLPAARAEAEATAEKQELTVSFSAFRKVKPDHGAPPDPLLPVDFESSPSLILLKPHTSAPILDMD